MASVVPAVIPQSEEHLFSALTKIITFTDEVQIDIVDGRFVPFVSWPITPEGNIGALKEFSKRLAMEIDLMVENPEKVLQTYIDVGVHKIVLHIETLSDTTVLDRYVGTNSVSFGIAISNDTPLSRLEPFLGSVDYVQLMGIAQIGSQGQPFDTRVLDRVREVKKIYPKLLVSVDGSVTSKTIAQLKDAGVDRFVSGSAILGAENSENAYKMLCELVTA